MNMIISMTTMIHSTMSPVLEYSPYIPQQIDIENNIEKNILNKLETNVVSKLNQQLEIMVIRLNSNTAEIEKLKNEFKNTIKFKISDSIICIILFIIIYIKVYT